MRKNIGSFSLMKRMNTALLLNLIREKGKISRTDLAKESGLTAATVTNLTAELIESGLIVECSTGVSTGGRKPVFLKINSDQFHIVTVSICPDTVEFAVMDFCAKILSYKHMPINRDADPDMCAEFIGKCIDGYKYKDKVIGIGVGVHGIVNSDEGISVYAPNLDWKNVNIKKLINKYTDIPVFVDNDVRCMALAEMWFGRKRNSDDFVYVYVGRGVGSAVVINNSLLRGSFDAAGEIGHTVIDINGPKCECGKKGCLQAFTNKKAMMNYLKDNLDKTEILSENSSCDDIVDAYLNFGDEAATVVIDKETEYLSYGISNIINVLDPGFIILSSDIKNFDVAVGSKLNSGITPQTYGNFSSCQIGYSSMGRRGILIGAASMVMSTVYDNPMIISKK